MAITSKQLVLFFEDATGYGWSERFWYAGGLTGAALTAVINGLANARAALLTSTCSITHIRLGSTIKRAPFTYVSGPFGPITGTETPPTAPAEVACLAKFAVSDGRYNRVFLRGIPERIVGGDLLIPDQVFFDNFQAMVAFLTANGFNCVGNLTTVPLPLTPITGLTPTPPRGIKFDSNAGLATIGATVRIRGALVPGYNGLKTVVSVDSTGLIFTCGGASPPVNDTSTSATAQLQVPFDLPIAQGGLDSLTRRGAGRPFGLVRGRRQTLYSLRR